MYNVSSSRIIQKTYNDDGTIVRIYNDGKRDLVPVDRSSPIEIAKLSDDEFKILKEELHKIDMETGSDIDLILKARKIVKKADNK